MDEQHKFYSGESFLGGFVAIFHNNLYNNFNNIILWGIGK